jgi:capsule polysaccharide export protein KpsE/RkpR
MEVFIRSDLDEKNQTAVNTIKFIDNLLMEITDSLASAESNLMQFRQSNKIIDISKEGSAVLEKLETYQQERNQLDIKLKYYNSLLSGKTGI